LAIPQAPNRIWCWPRTRYPLLLSRPIRRSVEGAVVEEAGAAAEGEEVLAAALRAGAVEEAVVVRGAPRVEVRGHQAGAEARVARAAVEEVLPGECPEIQCSRAP